MRITRLNSFPAGSNPFHHDAYHMGTGVNSDIMIMHSNERDGATQYIIVVETKTGRRTKIEFESALNQCDGCNAGIPVDENGYHRAPYPSGWMACQAKRYVDAHSIINARVGLDADEVVEVLADDQRCYCNCCCSDPKRTDAERLECTCKQTKQL